MDDEYVNIEVNVENVKNFGGPNLQVQAKSILDDHHLLQVGFSSIGSELKVIDAICLQSSHPGDKPHHILIRTHSIWSKWQFYCSCRAGLGERCKHLLAVLLYIEKYKRLQILSCTQLQQKWDKVSKEVAEGVLKPEKIVDFQEVKHKKQKIDPYISSEERLFITEVLFSAPNSALHAFINSKRSPRYRKSIQSKSNEVGNEENHSISCVESSVLDFTPQSPMESYLDNVFDTLNLKMRIHFFDVNTTPHHVIRFYNQSVCIDKKTACNIQRKTISQFLSSDWKQERRKRITASECYGLFTYFTKKNRSLDEWSLKVKRYFSEKPNIKNFQIGREQEPRAKALYREFSDATVFKVGLIIHPSCPWLGVSPDGFCIKTETVIEIKCVMNDDNVSFETVLKKLTYLKHSIDSSNEIIFELKRKHKYYAQVQLNMCFLNCRMCHFLILEYKQNKIKKINVQYDEAFVSHLILTLNRIYMKYCLSFVYENMLTGQDKENFNC